MKMTSKPVRAGLSKGSFGIIAAALASLCFLQLTGRADDNDEEAKFGKRPEGISDLDWEKLKAKRPLPFDKGPSTIDISKYPKEMQEIYEKTFVPKCSKCHTIARPINSPYALPEEWMNYIRKMMKKPGSGIDPNSAKKIYEFLVYDSDVRKKDIIGKKLKEKADKDKKAE